MNELSKDAFLLTAYFILVRYTSRGQDARTTKTLLFILVPHLPAICCKFRTTKKTFITNMSTLKVTNSTITLDNKVYQVRNITSVGKYRIKPNYFFKLKFIIAGVILSLLGIEWMKNNPDVSLFTWSVIILTALGIIERFTKAKRYGISIETSAGSMKLLTSKDEILIDRIINTIAQIMNNQDKAANYTFNISDGDIINQSGSFENGVQVG